MAGLNYEEMLKSGRKKLPDKVLKSERFEIPKVKGQIQGNKTIVTNFIAIANAFNRDPQHLLKYLQRELAAPAHIEGQRLILGRKISAAMINTKIEQYAKDFVICKECGRPDTQLKKEQGVLMMKCMACGAKRPIKAKI